MQASLYLVVFWVLFFRGFFLNPWSLATSDMLSTYFSHWRYLGRTLNPHDSFHFGKAWGIPFTSIWYPAHWLSALLARFFPLNAAFLIYATTLILHYLFASYFAYLLFGNLLAAITLTYAMRAIHVNQSIVYSWGWLPFTFYMIQQGDTLFAALGVYMMVAGGYWPILMFATPFFFYFGISWQTALISVITILPQLTATFLYMRGSVRTKADYSARSIGSVPPWHLISFLLPLRFSFNGVLYPELSYGIGRIGVILGVYGLFLASNWLLTAITLVCLYLAMGRYLKAPILVRIPARAMFGVTIALSVAIGFVPLEPEFYAVLLLLQSADILIHHPGLLTFFPFTEPGRKPSKQFRHPVTDYLAGKTAKVSGLPHPLFAGHITGVRGLGYCGGCMLLKDAEARGITDMNGDGSAHDWFSFKEDGPDLDAFGITHVYKPSITLTAGKWIPTEIPDLWENTWLTRRN